MGADWGKLALIHCMIGYEANVLGMLSFSVSGVACVGDNSDCEAVQAMLILGFLIYTAGGILMVLTKLGGVGASIIFTILSIAAFIIAALFIFIGVGLNADGRNTQAYASTLSISAAILGLLASVFLLLALLCKGKGSSTSPS